MTGGWLVLLVLVLIVGAFVAGFVLGAVLPGTPSEPEAVTVIRQMQQVHDATMTALASTGLAANVTTTTTTTTRTTDDPPPLLVVFDAPDSSATAVNTPRQRGTGRPAASPPLPRSIPGAKPVTTFAPTSQQRRDARRAARRARLDQRSAEIVTETRR